MKINRKLLIGGGLVAAVAASGGAFTAGFAGTDGVDVAASGNVTVDGATVLDVDYGVTGTELETVTVKFDDVYELAGATPAAFTLSIDGTNYVTGSGSLLNDGGVDGDDVNLEGDATVVTFTVAANTLVESVTSTDIVVVSENPAIDDNASNV